MDDKEKKGIDLDKFEELLRQTLSLVKERQVGLASWNILLADRVEKLKEMLANG